MVVSVVFGLMAHAGTAQRNVTGSLSTFIVTFEDAPDSSYEDVFVFAVEQAAEAWPSSVPVRVRAVFQVQLALLGTGRASTSSNIDGVQFPIAAAEAIRGENINGEDFDVIVQFSNQPWYTETVGAPGTDQFDLWTVALHELMHGLFYTGNFRRNEEGTGAYLSRGLVGSFDQYVAIGDENYACAVHGLLGADKDQPSDELLRALTSDALSFLRATDVGNIFSPLYAPEQFLDLSSVYHIDPTDQGVSRDLLMSPTIPAGTLYRSVGQLTRTFMNSVLSVNAFKPNACFPGDWDDRISQTNGGGNNGGGSTDDGTIAGLPKTTFYIIVGVAAGVTVLIALLGIWCCLASTKRKKRTRVGHGYVSPGGYMSPGYQPPYSAYASGYATPSGGGGQRAVNSGRINPTMMSPGMYTPSGGVRGVGYGYSSTPGAQRSVGGTPRKMNSVRGAMPNGGPVRSVGGTPQRRPSAPLSPRGSGVASPRVVPGSQQSGRINPGAQLRSPATVSPGVRTPQTRPATNNVGSGRLVAPPKAPMSAGSGRIVSPSSGSAAAAASAVRSPGVSNANVRSPARGAASPAQRTSGRIPAAPMPAPAPPPPPPPAARAPANVSAASAVPQRKDPPRSKR